MTPKIPEATEVLGASQGKTHFLEGFALGGSPRCRITGLEATSGKGHVPRPRIPRTSRSLDEEDFGSLLGIAQQYRHCRPTNLPCAWRFGLGFGFGFEFGETFPDVDQRGHSGTIARRLGPEDARKRRNGHFGPVS